MQSSSGILHNINFGKVYQCESYYMFFQLIINDSRIKKALIVIGNLTKTVSYIILHLRPPTFVECMPIINYKIKMPVFVNFVSAFGYVINSFLIVKLFGKRKALLLTDAILSNW